MTSISGYLLSKPNWSSRVVVGKTWQTPIQKAVVQGAETRQRLFPRSLFFTRFHVDTSNYNDTALLKRTLYKYMGQVVGVPLWPFLCRIEAEAASGQADVTVGSAINKFFTYGRDVVLFDPDDLTSYEAGSVISISDTVITLSANLSSTWDEGNEIVPVIPCLIGINNSIRMVTDNKGGIEISAEEVIE